MKDTDNKSNKDAPQRTLKQYAGITARGFCMGSADVVPGVSGGTMAFILGIYEELIFSIRSFDLAFAKLLFSGKFKEAFSHARWKFLLALVIGIGLAVKTLAKGLSWMLDNQPIIIWSFFFGLIVASVWAVSKHIKDWSPGLVIWTLAGAVFTYFLVGMVPATTPDAWWFIILSGAIAICAMILPGISGAFILVLLGKYQTALDAVHHMDFFLLFLFAMGAGCGLLTFVRVLNLLFSRFHNITIAILTGFMVGSLRKVWPWKDELVTDLGAAYDVNILPAAFNSEVFTALGMAALGFALVMGLSMIEKIKAKAEG